jgi:hypothetical protein
MPNKYADSFTLAPRVSWWLEDGDEECPHCGGMYAYEIEFRCTECDGPGCRHCVAVHAEGHLICLSCHDVSRTQKVHHG